MSMSVLPSFKMESLYLVDWNGHWTTGMDLSTGIYLSQV